LGKAQGGFVPAVKNVLLQNEAFFSIHDADVVHDQWCSFLWQFRNRWGKNK
jgi:hypothetical protein